MTTLIKKAGLDLFETTKNFAYRLCSDGQFCESVSMYALSAVVASIMWLSLAQL